MHRFFPTLALLLSLLIVPVPPVFAQAQDVGPSLNFSGSTSEQVAAGTSYHAFYEPGETVIRLFVMGEGINSGLYAIGAQTTLNELLALSGAGIGVSSSFEIDRSTTMRLLRRQGEGYDVIYEAPLNQALREPGRHPDLQENDLLELEQELERRFTVRDLFTYASGISSLTLLIFRLSDVVF